MRRVRLALAVLLAAVATARAVDVVCAGVNTVSHCASGVTTPVALSTGGMATSFTAGNNGTSSAVVTRPSHVPALS